MSDIKIEHVQDPVDSDFVSLADLTKDLPEDPSAYDDLAELTPEELDAAAEADGEDDEEDEEDAPKAKAEPTPEPEGKYKVKANGKELELTLPELLQRAALAEGAEARFQEAAKARKEVEEAVADPDKLRAFLKKHGKDLDDLADDLVLERARRDSMSPGELAQLERDQAVARLREIESEKQAELEQAERSHEAESLQRTFSTALEEYHLPRTPATVSRMAQYMLTADAQGVALSPAELAQLVQRGLKEELTEALSQLPEDKLLEFLGEDLEKKVSKARAARFKGTPKSAPTVSKRSEAAEPEDEWITFDQMVSKAKSSVSS